MNGRTVSGFDWTLLQSFLAVAQLGSFSAAARETGRSQPTIGRHIQQLQDQLGSVLFLRIAGGYQLTQTGTALMGQALAMQAAAARISMIAEGGAEDISGTVRITASEIVATYILPDLLGQLLRNRQGLQIELVATNSNENLMLREADIAVRMVRPKQPDLISRKLGEVSIGLFAAQAYLDDRGAPAQVEDIRDHILIGYDRSDLLIQGMADLNFEVSRQTFDFRIDNQVAYLEAICAGVGIGATQVGLAQARGLIPVLPQIPIPALPVWLTAHQELRSSARVRLVFDFLAKHLPVLLT